MPANDPGLDTDSFATHFHTRLAPVPRYLHEDAIGNGLTRQTGPRRAKCDRDAIFVAETEQCLNFFHAAGEHHGTRNQPVHAGVGSEGDAVNGASEDTGGIDYALQQLHVHACLIIIGCA